MKNFLSIQDVESPAKVQELIHLALELKKDPRKYHSLGVGKTMGLCFINPSLRTRLSTHKAAVNLGMDVLTMNFDSDGWGLETRMGVVMQDKAGEHIKEGAAVIGEYCDIIGLRSFAGLKNRDEDYSEQTLNLFAKYANKPMVNMESATVHPLQSLTDAVTISELKQKKRPKVVLTWAPHCKALPQAVPNSFAEWMNAIDVEFVIAQPHGYELDKKFAQNALVTHDQDAAFKNADFIYAKNWSATEPYGQIIERNAQWMVSARQMALTNNAHFMHCLPVRRNLVVADEVLDSPNSVVIQQAGNRVFAAQAVLKTMLESL